jgi:hypothetical protein
MVDTGYGQVTMADRREGCENRQAIGSHIYDPRFCPD